MKALTEARALELAHHHILVYAIASGPILALGTSQEESDEIVKAVLALIDTDFITGETIRVDGGRHLS